MKVFFSQFLAPHLLITKSVICCALLRAAGSQAARQPCQSSSRVNGWCPITEGITPDGAQRMITAVHALHQQQDFADEKNGQHSVASSWSSGC
jgi:hypothetical protein